MQWSAWIAGRAVTRECQRELVGVACTISAGVHAALTPAHLREKPLIGFGFGLSVLLLAGAVLALRRAPDRTFPAAGAAILLAGLIAAYAATRLWHLPGLAETPEPVDVVGSATKLVEATGLLLAVSLATRPRTRARTHLTLLPNGGDR
jgi:hypothetical protein